MRTKLFTSSQTNNGKTIPIIHDKLSTITRFQRRIQPRHVAAAVTQFKYLNNKKEKTDNNN